MEAIEGSFYFEGSLAELGLERCCVFVDGDEPDCTQKDTVACGSCLYNQGELLALVRSL